MTELLIIVLLTVVNGLFSMSETSLLSVRRTRLQAQADKGDRGAATALELIEESNRFLSTVQIGITLVGTLLGAFGGATVADDLARALRATPALAPYADALALALIVVVTTYIQLIIGELVPKRLALRTPELIASTVARPMRWLSIITAPVIQLLSASTNAVLWLLGANTPQDTPVTEEEITALLQQGVDAGVFEASEHEMVESVFKLGDRRVTQVMTPRTEIVWLDIEDPSEVNLRKIAESHFSRFPVCEGSLDEVIGMVRAKDLLPRMINGQPFDLREAMVPPTFVPESLMASRALELFRQTGKHIVFVVGEYGGLQGLVTTQDILEEIVGDIEEPDAVMREDGSYLVDGLMAVEDFKELLSLDALPGEGDLYETIGGFVMTHQGKIPKAGDHFTWNGLRFEVMDMDGKRVDKILVARSPTRTTPDEADEA